MTQHRPLDQLDPQARAALLGGQALRNGRIPQGAPISIQGLDEEVVPFNLPEQPIPQDFQQTIAGIPEIPDLTPTEPTTQETQQVGLQTRLLESIKRLGGRGEAVREAEIVAEVPQFQKQLRDITSQLTALQREAKAIPLQTQEEARARGITAAGLAPITTARLRRNAIKSLGLSAIANVLQGNLASANDQVNRAIEAEFGGIESEIDFIRTALEINRDILSREDKKRADALMIRLDERERLLSEEKADRKAVFDISLEAARNGADAATLSFIQESESREEALRNAGGFIRPPEPVITTGIEGAPIVQTGISPITGKVFTTSQSQAATFAVRMEKAVKLLEGGKLFRSIPLFGIKALKSNERRQFEQAEKNFLTAVLRRESGAAISSDEFTDARQIYIPQFGDDEDTLAQKALARQIVFTGLVNESVGAFTQLQGSIGGQSTIAPQEGTTSSGIKYTIE